MVDRMITILIFVMLYSLAVLTLATATIPMGGTVV